MDCRRLPFIWAFEEGWSGCADLLTIFQGGLVIQGLSTIFRHFYICVMLIVVDCKVYHL